MFESDADRLAMIQGLGGQLVRHQNGQFWAIFDRAYLLVIDAVESRQPVLTARTSDVSDLPKDVVLEIAGEQFRIKRPEPDGAGMSTVVLKR